MRKFHRPTVFLAALITLSLATGSGMVGCAAPSPESTRADTHGAAVSYVSIDAVLPAGEAWQLFRHGGRQFIRVPARSEAWTRGVPLTEEWLNVAPPPGPFRPVRVLPALRGHFYLLDAAGARLALYDSTGGLISTFPLPARFTPFPAGRADVFRAGGDAFTFLDYSAGEAWQYAERRSTEGTGEWIARGHVKLPLGVRDCMQAPGSAGLACVIGRGNSATPVRFDAALNRVPFTAVSGDSVSLPIFRADGRTGDPSARWYWDAGEFAWIVEGFAVAARDDAHPLFRYVPARQNLLTLSPRTHVPIVPVVPVTPPGTP